MSTQLPKNLINELARIHGPGVHDLWERYEHDLIRVYSYGCCADLSYMVSLYCQKANIECKIVWLLKTTYENPMPWHAEHIGCVIDDKFYDIIWPNGIVMDQKGLEEIFRTHGANQLYYPDPNNPLLEFDPDSYDSECGFSSFEDIVDHVMSNTVK